MFMFMFDSGDAGVHWKNDGWQAIMSSSVAAQKGEMIPAVSVSLSSRYTVGKDVR